MKKIIWLALSLGPLVAWFYAVLEHLNSEDWMRLALAVFIPPAGAIDGIGMYLGWW